MSVIVYHVLANPQIRAQLVEELGTIMGSDKERVTWNQLEQLPYFTAVVSEGLRLSYGVTTHLQRVSDEVLVFEDWNIPAGVSRFPSPDLSLHY
jgi:cytochrome P450